MTKTEIKNLLASKEHILMTKENEFDITLASIKVMLEQYKNGDSGILELLVKASTNLYIKEQEIRSIKLDILRLSNRLVDKYNN